MSQNEVVGKFIDEMFNGTDLVPNNTDHPAESNPNSDIQRRLYLYSIPILLTLCVISIVANGYILGKLMLPHFSVSSNIKNFTTSSKFATVCEIEDIENNL